MSLDAQAIGERVRDYLDMQLRPVGVKFLGSPVNPITRLDEPMRYCHAVHEAARGRDFVFTSGDQICKKAEAILGFREPRIVNVEPRIKSRTQAVSVGPLQDADQVILVLNPQQAMTMVLLLGGIASEFTGRFSICGEITAQVALQGQPRLSLLCDGARRYGEFTTEEVALGLPYDLFLQLPEKMSKYGSMAHKARSGLKSLFSKMR
ncbi:MAG: hypothetical protein EPO21_10715 [Chloroflexota bacterium]|nr:MAG: hypothetical protein EPO21_10715 [Chloroflexota bacterium]